MAGIGTCAQRRVALYTRPMASLQGESVVRGDGRQDEQPALRRYLDTIKERWWFVVLAVVVCTAAATIYAMTASKVYEASADSS